MMVGPMDFTTNDECGLLIEGHERPPIILSPWHHPYYQALLEGEAGLAKAMDLYMWSLHVSGRGRSTPRSGQMAGKVEAEHGIVCRQLRRATSRRRSRASWRSTTPPGSATGARAADRARRSATTPRSCKPMLDENWAFVAEHNDTGEVVGAALTLPDYNQVLAPPARAAAAVRLGEGALLASAEDRRGARVRARRQARLPAHRRRRALLPDCTSRPPSARRQKGGEMGWILETNRPMNRAMEGMGGEIVRRFRVYERKL